MQTSPIASNREGDGVFAAVERIAAVSTIPLMLKKILDTVEDERSTIYDLVELIERDPSLASRVTGIANTAFYAYRRKVKNIHNAVFLLGFNMVRNLAVSISVFSGSHSAAAGLRPLWCRSFEVAMASGLIAERTGLAKKEDAFLAGLINDIGRVIFHQTFGDEYVKVAAPGRDGLLERERAAFGANHSEVGAHFAWKYNFPEECVLAIQFHHSPEAAETLARGRNLQIIPIVYLADAITSEGGKGTEYDLAPSSEHKKIADGIYLDDDGIAEIRSRVEEMRPAIKEFYAG